MGGIGGTIVGAIVRRRASGRDKVKSLRRKRRRDEEDSSEWLSCVRIYRGMRLANPSAIFHQLAAIFPDLCFGSLKLGPRRHSRTIHHHDRPGQDRRRPPHTQQPRCALARQSRFCSSAERGVFHATHPDSHRAGCGHRVHRCDRRISSAPERATSRCCAWAVSRDCSATSARPAGRSWSGRHGLRLASRRATAASNALSVA